MLLSIIVPAYNVEAYIKECLDSCLNQDITSNDYEIIIVNDGSTDSTGDIAVEYEKSNSNIKVINKRNGGLSTARNSGLEIAKGDYIWFVDSDDWIVPNCLRHVLSIAEGKDITAMAFAISTEGVVKEYHLKKTDSMLSFYQKWFELGAPHYIWRKKFIVENKLFFIEGIYHEDMEYMTRAAVYANSFTQVYIPTYTYRACRPGSIMTVPRPKRAFDLLIVGEHLERLRKLYRRDRTINRIISKIQAIALNNALNIIKQNKEFEAEWLSCLDSRNYMITNLLNATSLQYKIEGIILSLPFYNKVTLYKIMKLSK